jgi:biotin carboxylase
VNVILVGRSFPSLRRLRELGHAVFLLCEAKAAPAVAAIEDELAGWSTVESYSVAESIWGALVRLGVCGAVDAVVAGTERAVVPSAVIAAILGARGQDPETTLRCRDKGVQKRTWNAAAVPTTPWAVIPSGWDEPRVAAELARAGVTFPAVAKPLASGGASLVFEVTAPAGIGALRGRSPLLEPTLVESYVAGAEWHFDGYAQGGAVQAVMVSQYVHPLLETKTGAPVASVSYPPAAHPELYDRARRFVQVAVTGLSLDRGVFHLEAFGGPDRWLASELAARPGGSWISEIARSVIGLDLWAAHVDLTLGRAPEPAAPDPAAGVLGLVHLPSAAGQVNHLEAADIAGLPGVVAVNLKVPTGAAMPDSADSTGACRATVLVRAGSVPGCRAALAQTITAADALDAERQLELARPGAAR